MAEIWHNPRCGKSRNTLKLLQEKGEDIEVVEYLKTPPSEEKLTEVINQLGIEPLKLIRRGESVFKENFKGKDLSHKEWIKVMVDNPILIERPVVIKNGKARIGRPPEDVLEIL